MQARQSFIVNGHTVHLIAGDGPDGPAVACAVELVDYPELRSLSIYFPMRSRKSASRFVLDATQKTAERGYHKVMSEHRNILDMVNRCLSAPMPPAWKTHHRR